MSITVIIKRDEKGNISIPINDAQWESICDESLDSNNAIRIYPDGVIKVAITMENNEPICTLMKTAQEVFEVIDHTLTAASALKNHRMEDVDIYDSERYKKALKEYDSASFIKWLVKM